MGGTGKASRAGQRSHGCMTFQGGARLQAPSGEADPLTGGRRRPPRPAIEDYHAGTMLQRRDSATERPWRECGSPSTSASPGLLGVPDGARSIVLFALAPGAAAWARGTSTSRACSTRPGSPPPFDLLLQAEEADRANVFDIPLAGRPSRRRAGSSNPDTRGLDVGTSASTGAAIRPRRRGTCRTAFRHRLPGRPPDLAGDALERSARPPSHRRRNDEPVIGWAAGPARLDVTKESPSSPARRTSSGSPAR